MRAVASPSREERADEPGVPVRGRGRGPRAHRSGRSAPGPPTLSRAAPTAASWSAPSSGATRRPACRSRGCPSTCGGRSPGSRSRGRPHPARRAEGADRRGLAHPGGEAGRAMHGALPEDGRPAAPGPAVPAPRRSARRTAGRCRPRPGVEPVLHRRRYPRRRGRLLKPGPAAAWFNLGRPLVAGEVASPLVHAVSAADLASGISRRRRPPRVDLHQRRSHGGRVADTARAVDPAARRDRGRRPRNRRRAGNLVRPRRPFGACEQTLLFERRQQPTQGRRIP